MNYKKNREILLQLIDAHTSDELEAVVNGINFFDDYEWVPYGDRPNNVGTVEGQMHDADNALMEKITNSFDAILMRRCQEEEIPPKDKTKAPQSMTQAVEQFFGGKEKLRKNRSAFAKEWLRLTAEGKKDRPTITIIDKGEGQQPNEIKNTILSLNKDIKEKIPFVYGTYNQGGASPLGFSGKPSSYDLNYLQLVLCRRPKKLQDPALGKNHDHYGFTIVRKRFDREAQKFTYEYLVEKKTKDIYSFPPDSPILIDDYKFLEGCVIKLYDYQLPQKGNIVFRGLNEFIEKKLPKAPLPIYLKELRTNFSGGIDYTIFGFHEKLLRKSSIIRDGYPQTLPVDLGEIGKREIEIFLLKHKAEVSGENLDAYIGQPEKIFFIKDGLVLHTENTSWLRNECDLTDLSPYLFAFIDISIIDPAIAQMLHSGREKFKNDLTTREALDRLKLFFQNDTFKSIDKEYARFTLATDSNVRDDSLRKQVMRDLQQNPEFRELFPTGIDIVTDQQPGQNPLPPFLGTDLPEKFELLGANPREVEEGSYAKITFDIGAEDNLFERRIDQGEYDWQKSDKFHVTFISYSRGKLSFRIDHDSQIKSPMEEAIQFYLRVPTQKIEYTKTITFQLMPKIVYKGNEFPSFFELLKDPLKIPLGTQVKLNFKTDVENEYFDRDENPGVMDIADNPDLIFGRHKLKDGLLEIKVSFTGKEIKSVQDIDISIQDPERNFDLHVPVEIINPDRDPQLNLPDPIIIIRDDWPLDYPAWDETSVARIPNWNELKQVKINADSKPFEDLKKLVVSDRKLARDQLIKQVYVNSIWLFFEIKDLAFDLNGKQSKFQDVREEIFDRSMRASSRIAVQNIKKLIG